MIFSKKINTGISVFLSLTLMLTGCQQGKEILGDGDTGSAIVYRDHLTEEEKTEGSASFSLTENVEVDAKVTPTDKYKNGLAQYYMAHYYEAAEKETKEDFIEKIHLFGRDYTEFQKLVTEEMKGKFTGNPKIDSEEDGLLMLQDFKKEDGTDCELHVELFEWEPWKETEGRLNCPSVWLERLDEKMAVEGSLPHDVALYVRDYPKLAVPFLEDSVNTGEYLKKFLEELTGRELADTWECIPVTDESVEKIAEGGGSTQGVKLDEEYCVYWFYPNVAGLPYIATPILTYSLKDGERTAVGARAGSINETTRELTALNENVQRVVVSKAGIEGLYVGHNRDAGEVYKEASAVADPDRILQEVKEYYEQKLILHPVIITDISLVYMGYFSDGSEGEVTLTVSPFWRVLAYDGTSEGRACFIYNAFTGEYMVEGLSGV